MIEIKNVVKKFRNGSKNQVVLNNLDLSFEPGEFIAIYGPSGSGKSTLLNILGVMDRPNSGTLLSNGTVINSPRKQKDKTVSEYRRKKIGFVFQEFNLVTHLSVIENVKMPMLLDGVKNKDAEDRAIVLLDSLGIGDKLHKNAGLLSGGEQQRVSIARALANDPDMILADEPTGSLDTETSTIILDILKQISNDGKTVVVVTHDDAVVEYATRTIDVFNDVKEEVFEANQKLNIEYKKVYSSFFYGIFFAISNIKAKFKKFIITSLIASVAITSVLLALQVSEGIDNYIDGQNGNFDDPRLVYVYKQSAAGTDVTIPEPFVRLDVVFPVKLDDRIAGGHIRKEATVLGSFGDFTGDIRILTIFPETDGVYDISEEEIAYGRAPLDGRNEVIITNSLAKHLLEQSDHVILEDLIYKTLEVVIHSTRISGEVIVTEYDFTITGVFEEHAQRRNDGEQANTNVFMPLSSYTDIERYHPVEMKNTGNVAVFIASDLETAEELTTEFKMAARNYEQIRFYDLNDLADFMSSISMLKYIIFSIVVISLVLSIVIISILLHLTIVERRKEIAILKSIGSRKRDIKGIIYGEAILLGVSIWIFGIVTTTMLQMLINYAFNHVLDSVFISILPNLSIKNIFLVLLVSISVSVISAISPVNNALAIEPAKTINE